MDLSCHFTIEDIELYFQGRLDEARSALVREHVDRCEACRRLLAEVQENADIAGQLRDALEHPAGENPGLADDGGGLEAIEGYRLLREVHRGGQGVVYEAYQKATRRRVALKVLLGGAFAGEASKRRFEREIELAASLNHRSIVTIHDSGITRGNYYLVMDFVEGERLDHYVSNRNMSVRQKVELFHKICDAISYAHQRGVIHRDLKPSNILIDSQGEPFVLDFGLARRTEGEEVTAISTEGQLLGTPQYMAPEQAEGKVSDIDVRTDVYALGLILYKMLTGTHPYPVSGRVAEILSNIVDSQPTRPSSLMRHLDMDIEVITLKALAKEPNHRYQSVAELYQDIKFWLQGMPIVARSVSSIYVLRKLITRHRYASTAVGLMTFIVVTFLFISVDLYRSADAAKIQAENLRERLIKETADLWEAQCSFTFDTFLHRWQAGDAKPVFKVYPIMTEGRREGYAVRFLLDKRPLSEKEAEFRKKMGVTETPFVEFVLGEHYLKLGLLTEAHNHYRRTHELLSLDNSDIWLGVQTKNRLAQLSMLDRLSQGNANPDKRANAY